MAVITRDSKVGVPAQDSDESSVVISVGELKTELSNSQMKLRRKKTRKKILRYNVGKMHRLGELGTLKWIYHVGMAYPLRGTEGLPSHPDIEKHVDEEHPRPS